MKLELFQVDAFTSRLFGGNPAAVVPLERWLPDAALQDVARENNLSETAYFVPAAGAAGVDYELRWFTPTVEVDLCGHATLATAHVLWSALGRAQPEVRFSSRSGALGVARAPGSGDAYTLDFPARPSAPAGDARELAQALGAAPEALLESRRDLLAVFRSEDEVRALRPDMARLGALAGRAHIVTAPARERGVDFVSRFFAPAFGIPEDPVTGSAHCVLVPYWADRLGKDVLEARQVSARGGELSCELARATGRVRISGRAVTYLHGWIEI
jgi:PhzF family phenazine biosynthesis protein